MDRYASLAHVLIRCRLRPGREHAPNKQYVLNTSVHLIIRVYGICLECHLLAFHQLVTCSQSCFGPWLRGGGVKELELLPTLTMALLALNHKSSV